MTDNDKDTVAMKPVVVANDYEALALEHINRAQNMMGSNNRLHAQIATAYATLALTKSITEQP